MKFLLKEKKETSKVSKNFTTKEKKKISEN